MKASNKKWLQHHSAHDYEHLIQCWKKLAVKAGLELMTLSQQAGYETIALRSKEHTDQGGLYLSAGVHGDEPAAVWGLLEWAEANQKKLSQQAILILPCINPWGFAHNVRKDFRGRDLNRLFHNKTLPFFRAWRKLVGDQQFRLALNLHEDYDAQGIYVYQLAPRGVNISDQAFKQIEVIIPRESRADVDGQAIREGVVQRSGDLRKAVEKDLGGGYPEAIYLYLNHSPVALTFETPSEFAFHERVKVQRRFIEEAVLAC